MEKDLLRALLTSVANGEITPAKAIENMADFPYHDLGFAKVDSHRSLRNGNAEIVFCPGKEPEHVIEIFQVLAKQSQNVMGTRASRGLYLKLKAKLPEVQYFDKAKIIALWRNHIKTSGVIGVISAGTADMKVAEEAVVTAEILGSKVNRIYDVGVAGIHRLFNQQKEINECRVLIVVAGMEGALASVVGGLVDKPIIAVPTSIGYGTNFKGVAPLLSMLNSCASGIAVVNIDNGFGAGMMAHRINLLGENK